jgi:hypothetical protein
LSLNSFGGTWGTKNIACRNTRCSNTFLCYKRRSWNSSVIMCFHEQGGNGYPGYHHGTMFGELALRNADGLKLAVCHRRGLLCSV